MQLWQKKGWAREVENVEKAFAAMPYSQFHVNAALLMLACCMERYGIAEHDLPNGKTATIRDICLELVSQSSQKGMVFYPRTLSLLAMTLADPSDTITIRGKPMNRKELLVASFDRKHQISSNFVFRNYFHRDARRALAELMTDDEVVMLGSVGNPLPCTKQELLEGVHHCFTDVRTTRIRKRPASAEGPEPREE